MNNHCASEITSTTNSGQRAELFASPAQVSPRAPDLEASTSQSGTSQPAPAAKEYAGGIEIYTLYLREIGQIPLLTASEEVELAARVREGDAMAREKMITANLRLVVKIAREWEGYGLPLLDLISEGNIGLMKGVERFDPAKGARLSSYAAWWIKQSIRRAIVNQGKTVRLPVHMVDKIARMRRISSRLEEELGREPTDAEISEEMQIPAHKIAKMRSSGMRMISLDAAIHDDSDETFVAHLADESALAPDQEIKARGDSDVLHEAVGALTPRELLVLNRRFGLEDGTEHTLEEISETLGLTRERVRQIQNEAILKLRRGFARHEAVGVTDAETVCA